MRYVPSVVETVADKPEPETNVVVAGDVSAESWQAKAMHNA